MFTEDIQCSSSPLMHKAGSPDKCIGDRTGKPTEIPHSFCKRVQAVIGNITGYTTVEGGAKINRNTGIAKINSERCGP